MGRQSDRALVAIFALRPVERAAVMKRVAIHVHIACTDANRLVARGAAQPARRAPRLRSRSQPDYRHGRTAVAWAGLSISARQPDGTVHRGTVAVQRRAGRHREAVPAVDDRRANATDTERRSCRFPLFGANAQLRLTPLRTLGTPVDKHAQSPCLAWTRLRRSTPAKSAGPAGGSDTRASKRKHPCATFPQPRDTLNVPTARRRGHRQARARPRSGALEPAKPALCGGFVESGLTRARREPSGRRLISSSSVRRSGKTTRPRLHLS